jgi:hypothetical protein
MKMRTASMNSIINMIPDTYQAEDDVSKNYYFTISLRATESHRCATTLFHTVQRYYKV